MARERERESETIIRAGRGGGYGSSSVSSVRGTCRAGGRAAEKTNRGFFFVLLLLLPHRNTLRLTPFLAEAASSLPTSASAWARMLAQKRFFLSHFHRDMGSGSNITPKNGNPSLRGKVLHQVLHFQGRLMQRGGTQQQIVEPKQRNM